MLHKPTEIIHQLLRVAKGCLPFCLLMLLFVSCSSNKGKFSIEGNFRGMNQGELYIYGLGGTHPLDTIAISRGEFKYQIALEDPTTFILVFPNLSELPVFAESGAQVEIKGDATHLKETEVKGTKYNKEMTAFRLQTNQMTPPELNKAASEFIKEHPESPVSLYLLNKYFVQSPDVDYRQACELAELIGKAMPDNQEIPVLIKKLSGLQTLKVGAKMPAFNVVDINGKSVSLADMNAKINAIIVWSSWSYESIGMLNQIQRLEDHFGDRLKVLCVSIDANAKDCRRILNRDSIKWSTICDGQMWESPVIEKTGLSHLPDNIVFDNKGIITGYSLNTEKLLSKLEEMLE